MKPADVLQSLRYGASECEFVQKEVNANSGNVLQGRAIAELQKFTGGRTGLLSLNDPSGILNVVHDGFVSLFSQHPLPEKEEVSMHLHHMVEILNACHSILNGMGENLSRGNSVCLSFDYTQINEWRCSHGERWESEDLVQCHQEAEREMYSEPLADDEIKKAHMREGQPGYPYIVYGFPTSGIGPHNQPFGHCILGESPNGKTEITSLAVRHSYQSRYSLAVVLLRQALAYELVHSSRGRRGIVESVSSRALKYPG